ncbi:MAG TPA: DUF885 domain-containing protein [Acidimicrobiales bacterium]|nr:DUF885 domain-containing protein [Acidimicrobiales bacterium]
MTTVADLAERFHTSWLEAHPFTATTYGVPGYDHLMPDDSEEGDDRRRRALRSFLSEAEGLGQSDSSADDSVTLGCLRSQAEQELAGLESAPLEHTVTPMPFTGPASFLGLAARTVIANAEDAHNYVTRLRSSGDWLDQLTGRLKIGAGKDRLPVAPLVELTIAWADEVLGQEVPAALSTPEPPAGWDGEAAWREERDEAVRTTFRPALGRWVQTLRQLLPRCRPMEHAGLRYLPGGEDDYLRSILVHTTLPLTAEELHRTGLEQIEILEERARQLGAELGLGTLEDIHREARTAAAELAPEAAIEQAVQAVRRAEARAPEVFPEPLPPPCAVTPMPPVVGDSGMAPHYTPPRLDGSRPGTYWFNTRMPTAGTGWDLEAVAFHETVPGHHLQLSRIQQLSHLPSLQRQRSLTVFSEGWGLYAEQLSEEIGLYTDARSVIGAITASLMRAARLVLDTGIHHLGWSRQEALSFYAAHVPMPAEFLAAEIDRYIIIPGQALAYMTGRLELLRLRDVARRRLGDRFTLPGFHAAVLDQGSLPLPVLRDSIDRWLATQAG